MINKDLLDFIRSRQSEDMSRENITRLLINEGGWSREDIDEAFSVVENDKNSDSSEAPQTQTHLSEDQSGSTEEEMNSHEDIYESSPQAGIHTDPPHAGYDSTPQKHEHNSPVPLILVIVLLILGGVGVAAVFFSDSLPLSRYFSQRPPEDIWERVSGSFADTSELDSYAFEFDVTSASTVPRSAVGEPQTSNTAEEPELIDVDTQLTVNGAFDVSDPDALLGRADVSFSGSVSEEIPSFMGLTNTSFLIETRMLENSVYLNLREAPVLGFISLQPFEGQWMAVNNASEFTVAAENPIAQEELERLLREAQDTLTELEEINAEHEAIEVSYVGTENIQGRNSYHFQIDVNQQNLYDFLVAANDSFSSSSAARNTTLPPRDVFNESLEILEKISGDVYIDTSLYLPTRLAVNVDVNDQEQNISGDASVSFTFSGFNEPVEITAPDNARPIEEVMSEIFGGFNTSIDGSVSVPQNSADN